MNYKIDKFGVKWKLPQAELCTDCGQPDSCGNCKHQPLSDENVEILGGKVIPIKLGITE